MRTSIEFSDNILTVETFEDLGNAIDDLDVGRLEFSEPIRKVIIKNINRNLEKYEVQDYLFSSQLKELEAVDIIDSGKTLNHLKPMLESRNPASLHLCTLLSKPDRREVEVPVKYIGFEVPDEFVVGYGLDYAQKYRNLPYVGVVEND